MAASSMSSRRVYLREKIREPLGEDAVYQMCDAGIDAQRDGPATTRTAEAMTMTAGRNFLNSWTLEAKQAGRSAASLPVYPLRH